MKTLMALKCKKMSHQNQKFMSLPATSFGSKISLKHLEEEVFKKIQTKLLKHSFGGFTNFIIIKYYPINYPIPLVSVLIFI